LLYRKNKNTALKARTTGQLDRTKGGNNNPSNPVSPAVILSLLFGGLYAFGYSFSLGYFDAFNLDIDLFPRSSEIYVVKAPIGLISSLLLINFKDFELVMISWLCAGALLALLLYLIFGLIQKASKKSSRFRLELDLQATNRLKVLSTALTAAISPLIFIFLLLYSLLIFLVPAQLGLAVGKKNLEQAKLIECGLKPRAKNSDGQSLSACMKVFDAGNLVAEGVSLAAASNNVLMLTNSGVEIVYLKDGYRIVRGFQSEK
jgi:hypothetical protein